MFQKIQYAVGIALIIVGLAVVSFETNDEALGAPATQVTYQKNLIPLTTGTYTLGTTTKTWLNGYFDNICLNGSCKSAWPAGGGGGGGSIATSSIPTAGKLTYWTSDYEVSDVATGTLSETVSGLELNATRGLVGGAAVLSITSGYGIPLTASTTNWNTFYNTPSNRITDGTGLTWTTNTLDCDTANGSTQGCLTSTDWTSFNAKIGSTSLDTSAELSALLTDETGTGNAVFSAGPTFTATPVFSNLRVSTTGTTTLGYASSTALTVSGITNLLGTTTIGRAPSSTDETLDVLGSFAVESTTSVDSFVVSSTGQTTMTYASSTALTLAGQAWLANASSTSFGSTGNAWLTYASSTGLTATRLFSTNAALTYASTTSFGSTGTAWLNLASSTGLTATRLYSTNSAITYASTTSFGSTGNAYLNTYTATAGTTTSASSTNLFATNASTSALTVGNSINIFGGGAKTTANALCIQLTGSADLCDGGDATGAGGGVSDWKKNTALDAVTPTTTVGIVINASSTIDSLSGTRATITSATSTNLYVSGLATTTSLFAKAINFGSSILALVDRTMTALGIWDFGGADSVELPNGTAPTVDATGETALDTTSDQFVFYGASAKKVLGNGNQYASFTYATSTAWTGTTTIPLGTAYVAETWNGIQCFTDAGTLNVSIYDGTNRMNANAASTTVGTTVLSTNNTFTAGEKRYADVGTPASSPTKISCTVSKSITAD